MKQFLFVWLILVTASVAGETQRINASNVAWNEVFGSCTADRTPPFG